MRRLIVRHVIILPVRDVTSASGTMSFFYLRPGTVPAIIFTGTSIPILLLQVETYRILRTYQVANIISPKRSRPSADVSVNWTKHANPLPLFEHEYTYTTGLGTKSLIRVQHGMILRSNPVPCPPASSGCWRQTSTGSPMRSVPLGGRAAAYLCIDGLRDSRGGRGVNAGPPGLSRVLSIGRYSHE
ncbi:hypothetical protein LZ31DRAFT_343952 [Colletotrichum somersetense]|nr:hypothetical protein LZ31DRAFT_343952 [Colletotrichum somersetense]